MILRSATFLILLTRCGSDNIFNCSTPKSGVQCEEQSKDEKAMIALNNGDYDAAVTILKELQQAEPMNYTRYPRLSAALAAKAGLDIFNIVKSDLSGGKSLLKVMGTFLPTPASKGTAYANSLTDMEQSIAVLNSVPANMRSALSTDRFATSVVLQLTLYQSAYSVMLLNQFSYSEKGYDPSQLSKMTAKDAAAILTNLLAAGQVAGANSQVSSAVVTKAYETIQAQPGATDQEKIASYVQANSL